jgi:SAM-dependent methyltransferase
MPDIERYLKGDAIYGDDFPPAEIAAWYRDEKEGYADLGARDEGNYRYRYHALNCFHAYRRLPRRRIGNVLAFGGAYGDELLPIISRIDAITIVDPSEAFPRERVHNVPARYVRPGAVGELPLPDASFELITCLAVLHHVPNVSFVFGELSRLLRPGGYLALQEPIVSMGDWRHPRPGLTKRERGIPLGRLRELTRACALTMVHEGLCKFPLTHRLFNPLARAGAYSSPFAVRVDALLSASFSWNVTYHPTSLIRRLCPGAVFLLLQKPGRA